MIREQAVKPSDLWQQTTDQAANEARWLGPVATVLFALAMLYVVQEYFVQPTWAQLRSAPIPSLLDVLNQLMIRWVNAGAALSLAWALWEARLYLKRLENREVWVASTMKFLERIGESLLVSAVFSLVVAPTVNLWVAGHPGLDWNLGATPLVLLGLGLLLSLMARVLGQVLQTADELKAENDGIV